MLLGDHYEKYKELIENIIYQSPDMYELASLMCMDRFCQDDRHRLPGKQG